MSRDMPPVHCVPPERPAGSSCRPRCAFGSASRPVTHGVEFASWDFVTFAEARNAAVAVVSTSDIASALSHTRRAQQSISSTFSKCPSRDKYFISKPEGAEWDGRSAPPYALLLLVGQSLLRAADGPTYISRMDAEVRRG